MQKEKWLARQKSFDYYLHPTERKDLIQLKVRNPIGNCRPTLKTTDPLKVSIVSVPFKSLVRKKKDHTQECTKKLSEWFIFLLTRTHPETTTKTCLLLVGMTFLFFRFLLTMINNLSVRTKEKSAISVQFKSKIQIQQKYRIFKSSKTKKERVYNMAYHCCWLLVKRVRLDIYLSNAHSEKRSKIF